MAHPDERTAADKPQSVDSSVTIPLAQEEIEIGKRKVDTGVVRVRKLVREHEETIDQPLLKEQVEVKRVSVNRVVDAPIAPRREDDVLIVSVVEEVLVKQWVLKEELHISRRTVESHHRERVTLRSEEAIVERDSLHGSTKP
jgi:uncharacterized protein (TIGR02271 family)